MAKYLAKTKEGRCIFCEIIAGKLQIPGIFWEDKKFMAWLPMWPNTQGFTAIAPKKHFGSDVLSMPDKDLAEFILATKHVSKILLKHFDDVGRVGLIMEGMGIDHAHIKLIPMHGTGYLKKGIWKQIHSENDHYFDSYEGFISSNDGPRVDDNVIYAQAEKLRKYTGYKSKFQKNCFQPLKPESI